MSGISSGGSSRELNTDETGQLIAADKVEGTSVYNPKGESLGSVERVMLNKLNGRVAYAVVSFGGLFGIGSRYYPLPWEMLRYDQNQGGYVVDIDRDRLDAAPSYEDEDLGASSSEPDWSKRVDDFYGRPAPVL